LTNEIILLIECCKISPDFILIEEKISQIKNWDNLITLSYSHGVFPLVYKILKKYDEKIPLDKLSFMKQTYMDVVKTNMLMTSELIKITKILEENNIEAISFKGPVLSQLAYGDVVSRQYCDLDILLDEKKLIKTVNLFLDNGYENLLPLEIISNEICLNTIKDFTVQNKTSKINIEIHWNLFESKYNKAFKKLDISQTSDFFINQNKLKTLSNETLLIYLCFHGSKHAWERIEWMSDIDKFIRNNKIDFSKIDNLLEENSLLLGLYLSYILFDTPLEKKYISKISDEKIKKLSRKIFEIMIDKKYQENEIYRNKKIFFFQMSLYNNILDKFNFFRKTFFKISVNDCQTYYYNSKISYIFLRPFRLIKYYLKRIV
jgi:hypothetical protein